MILIKKKDLYYFCFSHLEKGLWHGIFSRKNGQRMNVSESDDVEKASENRQEISSIFSYLPLFFVHQEHGSKVLVIEDLCTDNPMSRETGK